jgi:hypothetical protein
VEKVDGRSSEAASARFSESVICEKNASHISPAVGADIAATTRTTYRPSVCLIRTYCLFRDWRSPDVSFGDSVDFCIPLRALEITAALTGDVTSIGSCHNIILCLYREVWFACCTNSC